jgi:hypothetical protein
LKYMSYISTLKNQRDVFHPWWHWKLPIVSIVAWSVGCLWVCRSIDVRLGYSSFPQRLMRRMIIQRFKMFSRGQSSR